MARALDVKPKKYDEAKLAAMVPPFNVRVEKIRGSTRSPIPLPEPEDGVTPAGTGWDLDMVRQLEQWLVTEWSGGGLYEVTITDSSPTPQTMTWQPYWDVKLYPEKTPPPLLDAASASAPPVAQPQLPASSPAPFTLQQGRSNMPPLFPNGLPQGQGAYFQPQQPGYYPAAPLPNPPMPGSFQWDAYQREVERRERENRDREMQAELKRLHDLKEKTEREAQAAQHAAALERERQANIAAQAAQASQINELRNMITGLASAIKETANAKPAVSPEVEAMREQTRQLEARLEREKAEREAERRDRETKEMIARMDQQHREALAEARRQAELQAAQMREMIATQNANKGPDQFLVMMQNQHRESVELAKEQSRNQLQQMQALQAFMMNPRDMMAMAKENATATDHAIERSTNFFGKVIETQQKVTENLLQMQPGSNGVVELVGNGMDRVSSLAERYLGGKQLEAQLAAQGQVQVAEAQARAYAQTVIAEQQRQAEAAQAAQPAQANTTGAGLGNAQPQAQQAASQQPPKKKKKKAAEAAPTNGVTPGADIKRLGKTDQEWFSVIMPQVQELRGKAHEFIDSIVNNKLDKNGNPEGWDPEHAAAVVIQAVQIVAQRQIMIPVLMELLFQDRFADFVDVLLPDPIVTQQYRDEVTQAIIRHANVASGRAPDSEYVDQSDSDDDDDDDDNDDDNDDANGDDDAIEAADDGDAEENTDKAVDARPVPVAVIPIKKPAPAAVPRRT